MLGELLAAVRGGTDQLMYFRHTNSPFSPWREAVDEVIAVTRAEAARYGLDAPVHRRRAYQVARMVVADPDGVHLQQRVPDAYQAYSPPSAATFHDGKRRYPAPADRLRSFRAHRQTLAYLLTPPELAQMGLGGSPPGGLGVLQAGERLDNEQVIERLRQQAPGAPDAALTSWAAVLTTLARGVAGEDDAPVS